MKRSEFLKAVFPKELILPGEAPLISYPTSFTDEDGFEHYYHRQQFWRERSKGVDNDAHQEWLYCVSTVVRGARAKRRLRDVRHAFVLPCDDVGTKAAPSPVMPSYIMQTSAEPDNYQHGFFLDPYPVDTPEGAAYFDGVLVGLANAGYNDKGCRSASRVIKLPGAIHKTGYVTQLTEWHPERVWGLEELVSEMDIEVAATLKKAVRLSQPLAIENVKDAVYQWLLGQGLTHGAGGSGFINVTCPWHEQHSNPQDFMAGYSPVNYGTKGRGFNCFHTHCADKDLSDFMQWVFAESGIGLTF